MSLEITGGINIAMKVPSHQHADTVAFYRNTIGLKEITDRAPTIGFEFGSSRLWIDEVSGLSQAEVWLELFTPNYKSAVAYMEEHSVIRCDPIETLPKDFKGGWIMNPANIVHLLREPDAW